MSREELLGKTRLVLEQVSRSVIGKNEIISKILMAIIADGHVLLEDIPGVGKTTLAKAFAASLGLECNRVQFTPDVMPSDLMGFNIYNRASGQFEFKAGAAMCNVLLADEINRTSPKTQSALLQIMEENSVSVDGKTYALPNPFFVIATQNPYGSVGTQKLPESQMDRFMIRLSMGYPELEDEIDILKNRQNMNKSDVDSVCVLEAGELQEIKKCVRETFVSDSIYEYVARIAKATRESKELVQGVSPRGSIALLGMAKAEAFLRGHEYVLPADVQSVIADSLAHRIVAKAEYNNDSAAQIKIIEDIAKRVKVPELGK